LAAIHCDKDNERNHSQGEKWVLLLVKYKTDVKSQNVLILNLATSPVVHPRSVGTKSDPGVL
jgi:hypothetical protein